MAWRVLDAQFWGVAQRRRRIFLVADFGGTTAPEILFKQDSLFGDLAQSGGPRQGTAAPTEGCPDDTGGACLTPWDEGGNPEDTDAPQAFRQSTKLSQHISFLKDFFRCYKDFSDRHIDAIEIMLGKLYENFGISDRTDFRKLAATDYPILSDLYALIETEYKGYDKTKYQLYPPELLQEILLGLHSMVTSEFGGRTDPITGAWAGHSGIDLGASKGTSIRAAQAGTVKTVVYGSTGYGYYLTIDHGGGLVTLYGHCSQILVREGQTVKAGETVAKVGSTGRSTGNHLHFEVRVNGVKQNPRSYLPWARMCQRIFRLPCNC